MPLLTTLALVTPAAASPVEPTPQPPAGQPPAGSPVGEPISDPLLAAAVEQTTSPSDQVAVELRTADVAATVQQVDALGGTVTGTVPNEVVQAAVPVESLDVLQADAQITDVRAPRRSARLHQFGPANTGADAIVNATAWHAAGITGAGVKIGVIDLFDMAKWDTAENGALPTVANGRLFCRDTSGMGDSYCVNGTMNPLVAETHGLAVVEQIKDLAPDAEIYIATAGTTSDLLAAVNFFADRGVRVINRSMGAAIDGPGDGTGPLAAVVDLAVQRGITWFNSAGNDARNVYARTLVPAGLGPDQPVPINGDPLLRIDGSTVLFDGIRWNDWYRQRTDYRVELWVPKAGVAATAPTVNPPLSDLELKQTIDRPQVTGDIPLEAEDLAFTPPNGVTYLRIVRNAATPVGREGDVLEIAIAQGARLEPGSASAAYTAARPVVDSANPGLIAVGAVDPPTGTAVATYSSRGPTNDGRVKPDLVAPSGLSSVFFPSGFHGTSASSPAVAGAAALLIQANLATGPMTLGGLIRSLTTDIAAAGPDNDSGTGLLRLPDPPPTQAPSAAAQFVAVSPSRLLDTREPAYGPVYVRRPGAVVRVPVLGRNDVPAVGVTAVVLNVTVVDSIEPGHIQVLPTVEGTVGATSNQNLTIPGPPRPAFVISRLGPDGSVSVYLHGGGNLVIDVLGFYTPAPQAEVSSGRLISVDPERWVDTRSAALLPAGFSSVRQVGSGETVRIVRPGRSVVPASGVQALVVNLTVDRPRAPGFLTARPTGDASAGTSNVNYLDAATSNLAIVPLGADRTISVFSLAATDLIVDVVGYITDTAAAPSSAGLLVTMNPQRLLDTRLTPAAFSPAEERRYRWTTPDVVQVPADATALSLNLTVTQPAAPGFLTAYPGVRPGTSNLNYVDLTNANASLLQLGSGGTVGLYMLAAGHVIVDLNGYFTGP